MMPPRPNILRDEVTSSDFGHAYGKYNAYGKYILGTSATSTGSHVSDEYYVGRAADWAVGQLKQDVGDLMDRVDKLELNYGDAVREALIQSGLADFKSKLEVEFVRIVEERVRETVETIEKAYKNLNERINDYEASMIKKLEKIDAESVKRQATFDKIDFLAKELGYQMEIADKSF